MLSNTDSIMLVSRDDNRDANGNFIFYHYSVSMVAAIIFIAIFGIETLLHIFQMVRGKIWFMIPFVIGCVFEMVGYIGRALSATENPGPYSLPYYIMQNILLLVAPALLAASIYMTLGRIVLMVDGDHALPIKRQRLTKTFVFGDIASFLCQAAGGGFMASKDESKRTMGKWVVVAGLLIQVFFFGAFVLTAIKFQLGMRKRPTAAASTTPWKKHMIVLYTVSALIFVRSIVRVVEFVQGDDGYIMTHEVFLYVFDATLMAIAVATMNWKHPAEVRRILRETQRPGDPELLPMASPKNAESQYSSS